MRTLLVVLAASVELVGCGGRDDGAEHAGGDTSTAAHHGAASDTGTAMHGGDHGQGGGDMKAQMGEMNTMMVSMLGASDSTYDRRFIDLMIPHHVGAVQMAQDALQKATHPELKQFAQAVIDAQQKEIAQMKGWRQQWYGDSAIAAMNHGSMNMDQMNQQMVAHLGASDSTYDQRFIDMMIPHHQGAVMMAQDAQSKATKAEIRDLSARIIADQDKEIGQLQAWRAQWYGQ
jgi:uncharacterized protein (DUF305 family)